MAGRDDIPPAEFARSVRDHMNDSLARGDHHPHGSYTPAAFRHYIRQATLLDRLEGMSFRTVLDVGCAEGYFMDLIRNRFGADVWGVDISTTALAKARRRYGLSVAGADATRLPFPDGCFDLVYATEVIEHVLEPERMVGELRRVSRGTVLVTTPVSQSHDEHAPDFALEAEGHINNFDLATVGRLFGPDAEVTSFRCNATLALIVAVGRHMPSGIRDGFYRLDQVVAKRFGSPAHPLKPLRNRDWLITLSDTGAARAELPPRWACPLCRGGLEDRDGSLGCTGCGARFALEEGVPDFFETLPTV